MKSTILSGLRAIRQGAGNAAALQSGRLFLWFPVALGIGAAAYLSLMFEPSWLWIAPPIVMLVVALWLIRRFNLSAHLYNFLLLFLIFVLGVAVCKLRAEHVKAPVLDPSQGSQYSIRAFVIDNASASEDAPRLLLAPVSIRGLSPDETPLRLRVSLRPGTLDAADIKPGDAISVFALLDPPPPPFIPGGYDFAQGAYFQGIGGVGFVPGQPTIIDSPPHSWQLDAVMKLNRLRWEITRKLVASIMPEFSNGRALGGFAAALVTGQQAFIPQTLIQDMRDSGLAHILSISGVHMAIVGGFVFFFLRAVMALIPSLALRVPIKKVAAALSMICVLLYLAISGAPAPAVRSAVVACVAFTAILLDRRALSLRALAIAAIIVILLTPEAVIQPGFEMSFCATAALLALAETMKPVVPEISVPWWVKSFQSFVHGIWLSLEASVVATLATTPFAIAYFNRFSMYGLFSNLFESPITGILVMPFLALGTVFVATPIGWVCLRIAGVGLWLIDKVAEIAAHLPGAVVTWASAPGYVLAISSAGLIWACLIRGKARWAGAVVAPSIVCWPRVVAPDVWVDPEGGNATIRTPDGAYALRGKVKQYGYLEWAHHYGLKPLDDTARDKDYECTGYMCVPLPDAKLRIGFWFSNKPPKDLALLTLCLNSDLVILRNPVDIWPQTCAGVNHISKGDFNRLGALELTRTPAGWAIKAAQPLRGHRFWSTPSDAEGDSSQ